MKIINEFGLLILTVTGLFAFLITNGQSVLPESRHYKLEKMADGVYAAIHNNDGGYAICNAGIIDMGDRTIVLDPFMSPAAARDLKHHAVYLTGKPVTLVFNLHGHSDHTGGNQVFVPGADIISTPNAREYIEITFDREFEENRNSAPGELVKIQKQLMTASGKEKVELTLMEDQYRAIVESLPELRKTLPNITISDTLIIHGSKRKLVVIPVGTGHTDGDMVVYLPDDDIIFMSDLVFAGFHPYFGDGNTESWIDILKDISKLRPELVVPGHGPVSDINSIYSMVDYIETLTNLVNKEIASGSNENRVMQLPLPEKFNDYLLSVFYRINLRFLYRKQTVEKSNLKD
ncbi:MAG: MBL fold metallo-hydrolase [Bacteroidales bacterium]|nr:MBL fold metallo-hydrolase [Bacteroidales bacterium]